MAGTAESGFSTAPCSSRSSLHWPRRRQARRIGGLLRRRDLSMIGVSVRGALRIVRCASDNRSNCRNHFLEERCGGAREPDHGGDTPKARKRKSSDHLSVMTSPGAAGDRYDAERMPEMNRFPASACHIGPAYRRTETSACLDIGVACALYPQLAIVFSFRYCIDQMKRPTPSSDVS
jgi:hypothetical protein